MRKGWPGALFAWGIALIGAALPVNARAGDPVPASGGPMVRLTVEVDWNVPAMLAAPAVEIGVSEGRVLGVAPVGATWPAIEPGEDGRCRIAPMRMGRVRARVEAPIGATLTVQAGSQPARIPLLRLLDGQVRTLPPTAIDIGVARVAWDVVEVDPGEFKGAAAPAQEVPLRVGFNVLSADGGEVDLKFTAELKSALNGAVEWHQEHRAVVATDTLEPTSWMLNVRAPTNEGLYTLEVRASWEPTSAANEGSRISRLLRRRKAAPGGSTSRRVSLAVVDPKARPTPEKPGRIGGEDTVDTFDLSRPRGRRPSASGRAASSTASWHIPEAAVVEETRRDRLRGWVTRVDSEPVVLAPADPSGMAWSAVGLKVPHPDRPHRLTVTVNGGHPSALGVGLVATGGRGRPRLTLDTCASGPPLIEGDRPASFSWLVWPEAAEPVLVLVNRNASAPVQLGTVTLAELNDIPAGPTIVGHGDGGRVVGIDLTAPLALDRFGGGGDPLLAGRNMIRYLNYCGATAAVLPDALADRARRLTLNRQGDEDPVGPDRLDLLLTLLDRYGMSAWVDLAPDAHLPLLPATDSPEALARGLVRVDRAGRADGPAYHPIQPEVRKALAKRVAAVASARKVHPAAAGVLIRLGPGATLLGRPDTGLDDATFSRFVAAMFDPGLARTIPGLTSGEAGRFEARAKFLEGAGQKYWLTWRARELAAVYNELAEAARQAAPGARLAVATPDLDAGTVGEEVRRLDRVGLGPAQAWRSVGLDLAAWSADGNGPIVLRGVGMSAEEFARDLASSHELDDQVANRPARGLWLAASNRPESTPELALRAPALPDGFAADEPLGHALAALDGRWFFAAGDIVAGREERVRRFAQVVRSLPAPTDGPTEPRPASGVAARITRGGETSSFLALANDTPYPIQLETIVRCPAGTTLADLAHAAPLNAEPVSGGLRVIADLPPFGVASARIDAADVVVESTIPHPGAAVLDGMKAQFDDLNVALARLNRLTVGASTTGPLNADFEAPALTLVSGRGTAGVSGWQSNGDHGASVAIDPERPHAGRSSLRLDAEVTPASVLSDPFAPTGRPTLTIHAWLRAERPDARVRLWIEGLAAGRPFARQLEIAARSDWTATGPIRASGIPDSGLESARLRFELLTPGRLWIDDVTVTGPALSESDAWRARRDLLAALSAYSDHRYADFARLAGSHWTRQVADPGANRLAGDRSIPIRTGDLSPSALPTGRRLR